MTTEELDRQIDTAIENLLSTISGRLFIARLLHIANVWYPSFDAESTHRTSYMEGRRAVGLELIDMLSAVNPSTLIEVLHTSHQLPIQEELEDG